MTFWAHSDPAGLPPDAENARWQPLAEHLRNVSSLARQLAEYAAPDDATLHQLARFCGLLHDYGKYTDCFQNMIRTGRGRCPHAVHGAAMVWSGDFGLSDLQSRIASALAILGHHAGIADGNALRDKLKEFRTAGLDLAVRAKADLPELEEALNASFAKSSRRPDLFTRILFSCLVDADRLDTAGRTIQQAPLQAEERLELLLKETDRLHAECDENAVKTVRAAVLQDCLAAAGWNEKLLSLTVPTGGGKTLSAMAFALQRAALRPNDYRRIIVVIPYLSIIEQNAEVYAKVFGDDAILEHHSGSFAHFTRKDKGEKQRFVPEPESEDEYLRAGVRPETENWDAPLIVTTSVRFFESLFSNHPSDLRRVHNIARSIVILDEVQVLPRRLVGVLLGIIAELATEWGCTFVFSTATQPAFEKGPSADKKDLRWAAGTVREIVASPAKLHRQLRRVTIDWRIEKRVDWPEVAKWISEEPQALCVVNVREHAAQLFEVLAQLGAASDALFHLSTRMCAAHRLDTLQRIRERLKTDQPCLVVSTQLIEAGVDLDFPIAFRALGPLDGVLQVGGRVDREGKLTRELGRPAGRLVVFKPIDKRMPPNEYEYAADMTEGMAKQLAIQPDDLNSMATFFERYYGEADLGSAFCEMRSSGKFASLAEQFEMISSRTRDVFVPYEEGKRLIEELRSTGRLTAGLRRKLQRYTVALWPWELEKARMAGMEELPPGSGVWIAEGFLYHPTKGLLFTAEPEALVV